MSLKDSKPINTKLVIFVAKFSANVVHIFNWVRGTIKSKKNKNCVASTATAYNNNDNVDNVNNARFIRDWKLSNLKTVLHCVRSFEACFHLHHKRISYQSTGIGKKLCLLELITF